MASYMQFEPDGLWRYKLDPPTRTWNKLPPDELDSGGILACLSYECRILDGTTLGDIFRAVEQHLLLTALISQYSCCPQIEKFHALLFQAGKLLGRQKMVVYPVDFPGPGCAGRRRHADFQR